MKITKNTMYNISLAEEVSEIASTQMLKYVDDIFSKVGLKTEEIVMEDGWDKDLKIKFITNYDIQGAFDLQLWIIIELSNLGAGFRKFDERLLSARFSAVPDIKMKPLQKVYKLRDVVSKEMGIENRDQDVVKVDKTQSYKLQLDRIFGQYNSFFEKEIEIYEKVCEKIIEEADPDLLSEFKDIKDIFIF